MNENGTESNHAQCEWCTIQKTLRMIEPSRVVVPLQKNLGQHQSGVSTPSARRCRGHAGAVATSSQSLPLVVPVLRVFAFVMTLGAENTLDVRKVQMRQLVMTL